MKCHPIEEAIEEIRQGRMIVLVDDENRENEGDFVFAAEKSTPELVNAMISVGRGLICMPMTSEHTRKLKLPQQVQQNEAPLSTAFTISIDAARGITTGISASDRNQTILAACGEQALPRDLVRPGHIFPLKARDGGCLVRPGHTEASVDLVRLAGLHPSAVICEILNEKGEAAGKLDLQKIAKQLSLKIYRIRDLVEYCLKREPIVKKVEKVNLPTAYGEFTLHAYQSNLYDGEDIFMALTSKREQFSDKDTPLVRVHSEWSIANIVNRLSNPQGSSLNAAMKKISEAECGVIVFLRHTPNSSEGSIPLKSGQIPNDLWLDGEHLKTSPESSPKGYGIGAHILRDLGVKKMKLLSNSSGTFKGIGLFDLEIVGRVGFNQEAPE